MANVYKVMGLRNELTDFLDGYVDAKWNFEDQFHVYVFDREGIPEVFSNEEDDTLVDFCLIRSSTFGGNQTVFNTDPEELEKIVLEKFKGKKIT